ncbi:hypothetical protein M0R45_014321 [Rubus argutus]|uniref:Protein Iojap, chloroplastic n=1 Tax=Rubus argutus TaxID=59490 RepID=A0AAW1XMP2_RUBAR
MAVPVTLFPGSWRRKPILRRPPESGSSKNTSRGLLGLRLAQGKGADDGFIPNVIYSRKDKKPPSAELDDDAESISFAVELARVANEVKAGDIKVLFVKPLVYWTRFFIIVTAFSRPKIDAIGSKMRDLAEKKYGKIPTGDSKPKSLTMYLTSYVFVKSGLVENRSQGDVVIHIFLPPQQAFYNLEKFFGNATAIELPFENQPPMRG